MSGMSNYRDKGIKISLTEEEYELASKYAELDRTPVSVFVRKIFMNEIERLEKQALKDEELKKGGDNFSFVGRPVVTNYATQNELKRLESRIEILESLVKDNSQQ
jgi:hypothetical protein